MVEETGKARPIDGAATARDLRGSVGRRVAALGRQHGITPGLLVAGRPGLVPCTPLGCVMLLRAARGDLAGLDAVVLGRSDIVGKPMALLLLRESCTVTVAHSKTRALPELCRRADIVVA